MEQNRIEHHKNGKEHNEREKYCKFKGMNKKGRKKQGKIEQLAVQSEEK
jgi:hypothetical protein